MSEIANLILKVRPITSYCFRQNPKVGKYMLRFAAENIEGEIARRMKLLKDNTVKDPFAATGYPPIITITDVNHVGFARNVERLELLSNRIDMAMNLNIDPDRIVQEMEFVTVHMTLFDYEFEKDKGEKFLGLGLNRVNIDENEFAEILYRKAGIL